MLTFSRNPLPLPILRLFLALPITSIVIGCLNPLHDPLQPVSHAIRAPVINYPGAPFIFAQNSAIGIISPVLSGDPPSTCTSTPPLPSGLTLDPASCTLSATPTASQATSNYSITATNASGSGTAVISIAIVSSGTPSGTLYVTNQDDNTVTFFNATTGAYINGTFANSTFPTGTAPSSVAVNPATNLLYVVNTGDNTVAFLDARTGAFLGSFPTGTNPYGIAINPVAEILYVGNHDDSTVTFFNARTGTSLGAFPTGPAGSNPNGVDVNTANNTLYVQNFNDGVAAGTVAYMDATTGTLLGTYTGGIEPTGILVDPAAGIVNMLDFVGGSTVVTRFDAGTGAYIGGSLLASDFLTGWLGPNPFQLGIKAAASRLYIENYYGNSLQCLNSSTGITMATSGTAAYPTAVVANPASDYLYVTSRMSNTIPAGTTGRVSFFTASTCTLIGGPYTTGANPRGVAIAP